MKIVLFGASGNVGQYLAKEALARGHTVIGVVRDPGRYHDTDSLVTLVAGDATDATSIVEVVRGADAIVNAISPRPNKYGRAAASLTDAARAFIAGARQTGVKRIVIVGGAGSLRTESGVALVDAPQFPAEYKAEALAQRDALEVYRREAGDLDWTYVSPHVFQAGSRTGRYRTTGEQLLAGPDGPASISFEDYAAALVDELEHPRHVKQRFGVAN